MPPLIRLLSACLLCCFALLNAGAAQARRVALVMGNDAYASPFLPQLSNPSNDVALIAATLERIGFEVWPKAKRTDLTQAEMNAALREFRAAAQGAEIGLIYYAGHGLQDAGENYFFPIDADPDDLTTLRQQSFTLPDLMNGLSGVTGLRIGLFDACRDNRVVERLRDQETPTRSALIHRGMAPVELRRGGARSLIAFPTAAGDVTPDGADGNSAFAKALARHLPNPDLEIRLLFGNVADDVEAETKRHRPDFWTNLGGDEVHLAMRTTGEESEITTRENELRKGGNINITDLGNIEPGARVIIFPEMKISEIQEKVEIYLYNCFPSKGENIQKIIKDTFGLSIYDLNNNEILRTRYTSISPLLNALVITGTAYNENLEEKIADAVRSSKSCI